VQLQLLRFLAWQAYSRPTQVRGLVQIPVLLSVVSSLEQLAGNAQRHSDAWKPRSTVDLQKSLKATLLQRISAAEAINAFARRGGHDDDRRQHHHVDAGGSSFAPENTSPKRNDAIEIERNRNDRRC
jgi:hypothetical protein